MFTKSPNRSRSALARREQTGLGISPRFVQLSCCVIAWCRSPRPAKTDDLRAMAEAGRLWPDDPQGHHRPHNSGEWRHWGLTWVPPPAALGWACVICALAYSLAQPKLLRVTETNVKIHNAIWQRKKGNGLASPKPHGTVLTRAQYMIADAFWAELSP